MCFFHVIISLLDVSAGRPGQLASRIRDSGKEVSPSDQMRRRREHVVLGIMACQCSVLQLRHILWLKMLLYSFVFVVEEGEQNYSAYVPDLPGCVATGHTRKEVEKNMREAIKLHVQGVIEDKVESPAPKAEDAGGE
jgi:predicted RNase H-like HicB family nuclease